MNKDEYSWATRLRICWCVLFNGECDLKQYKKKNEQEQWDLCRQRDKEMDACKRVRADFNYKHAEDEQ